MSEAHASNYQASPRQATRLDAIGGRFDPWLLGVSLALACFGVVMVASSSIAIGEGLGVGPFHFLERHLMFLAGGVVLALWLMRTELKLVEHHGQWLLLACFLLLMLGSIGPIGGLIYPKARIEELFRIFETDQVGVVVDNGAIVGIIS